VNLLLLLVAPALAQSLADDARPLPRYLDPDVALAVVQGASPSFAACLGPAVPPDGAVVVDFVVKPDGGVDQVRTQPSPPIEAGTDACLVAAVRAVRFPAHDEVPLSLRYTVAWKKGTLLPFPVLSMDRRPHAILFTWLPPPPSPEEQERIRQILGFDPFAAPNP